MHENCAKYPRTVELYNHTKSPRRILWAHWVLVSHHWIILTCSAAFCSSTPLLSLPNFPSPTIAAISTFLPAAWLLSKSSCRRGMFRSCFASRGRRYARWTDARSGETFTGGQGDQSDILQLSKIICRRGLVSVESFLVRQYLG